MHIGLGGFAEHGQSLTLSGSTSVITKERFRMVGLWWGVSGGVVLSAPFSGIDNMVVKRQEPGGHQGVRRGIT